MWLRRESGLKSDNPRFLISRFLISRFWIPRFFDLVFCSRRSAQPGRGARLPGGQGARRGERACGDGRIRGTRPLAFAAHS